MEKDQLLQSLKYLIDKYIDDFEISTHLKSNVTPDKVKYVLGELELNKNQQIKSEDREIIKDLFYYFC